MIPYVNIVNGKPERLYIQESSGQGYILTYRPTHYTMGIFSAKDILKFWKMSTEEFYAFVTRDKWFRLPKRGVYDFMMNGYYKSCESSYEKEHLRFTDFFAKSYNLTRLHEAIPYDYINYLRRERCTIGGQFVTCTFDETDDFVIDGLYADFADELFYRLESFDGHTKVELYNYLRDLISVELFSEILEIFKSNGINGISALKHTDIKTIAKLLVRRMNKWHFG